MGIGGTARGKARHCASAAGPCRRRRGGDLTVGRAVSTAADGRSPWPRQKRSSRVDTRLAWRSTPSVQDTRNAMQKMVLKGAGGGLGRGRTGHRPAGAYRPLDVWQRGFPSRSIGFSGASEIFSKDRAEVTDRTLRVVGVRPGEVVPACLVFDAVSTGTVERATPPPRTPSAKISPLPLAPPCRSVSTRGR